jgi:hypothetical protein
LEAFTYILCSLLEALQQASLHSGPKSGKLQYRKGDTKELGSYGPVSVIFFKLTKKQLLNKNFKQIF